MNNNRVEGSRVSWEQLMLKLLFFLCVCCSFGQCGGDSQARGTPAGGRVIDGRASGQEGRVKSSRKKGSE